MPYNAQHNTKKKVHDGFVTKHCFPNKVDALYTKGSCIFYMRIAYVCNILCSRRYIRIYIYIYFHSAVATATVLQTIRPSCVCPPTSDPSPPTQTLALRSTSPVIQPSFPPICNPPLGQSLPIYIYIYIYTPYTTSSSVPGRARRVIYAPPSSPPPSHCHIDYCTPPPAPPRLYIL